MKTIYRYQLAITDRPVVDMPGGAVVLPVPPSVRNQDRIEVWALVDTERPPVARGFLVVGTGHPMPEVHGPFLGTVVTHGGAFVWHVFEATPAVSLRNPDGAWK